MNEDKTLITSLGLNISIPVSVGLHDYSKARPEARQLLFQLWPDQLDSRTGSPKAMLHATLSDLIDRI